MKIYLKYFVLFVAISLWASSCNNFGKKVSFDGYKGEVYFTGDGIAEGDAKKLGEYLKTINYINKNKETSFQISKKDSGYNLKMVVEKARYDTIKDIDESFKALGFLVSKNVFGGKPVNVILTNNYLEGFKTVAYDPLYAQSQDFGELVKVDGTQGEVYYKGDGVTEADAKKLGDELLAIHYFSDKAPSSVQLMKSDVDGYIVRLVYDKAFYESKPDEMNQSLQRIASDLSSTVFQNKPVAIALADDNMQDFKVLPFKK